MLGFFFDRQPSSAELANAARACGRGMFDFTLAATNRGTAQTRDAREAGDAATSPLNR